MEHRFLIVKESGELTEQEWDALVRMFDYLPQSITSLQYARDRMQGSVKSIRTWAGRCLHPRPVLSQFHCNRPDETDWNSQNLEETTGCGGG